jgi:hypothetical protein
VWRLALIVKLIGVESGWGCRKRGRKEREREREMRGKEERRNDECKKRERGTMGRLGTGRALQSIAGLTMSFICG